LNIVGSAEEPIFASAIMHDETISRLLDGSSSALRSAGIITVWRSLSDGLSVLRASALRARPSSKSSEPDVIAPWWMADFSCR
jgi:hypothetical protein